MVEDEVAIDRQSSAAFDVKFENTLYNSPAENASVAYADCLLETDPIFNIIDPEKNIFDFHLQPFSPCIDAGAPSMSGIDLDGNKRDAQPDIGCYEAQP